LLTPSQRTMYKATGRVAKERNIPFLSEEKLQFLSDADCDDYIQNRKLSNEAKRKIILAGATPAAKRPFIQPAK